jgi:lipopolysaccharide transport system ATP-binding protein
MSSPIISVENLGKRYTIRHRTGRPSGGYRRLSEELVEAAKGPFRSLMSRTRADRLESRLREGQSVEDFWALRNVSFDVNEGDVLGVIGGNGAGKSTLLKILSRITEPSEGRVTIRGRVASLLEVGTGFHPELTGRENIYLNGAILGMSRAEISRKFDEIVAFAEIEKFLDTPVKRYSSGMYVRLAFAVAAHLDPEILLVDEVLAVGDAEFQKRCLGKLQEVSTGGRTVLFVSHQMAAIENLCHTGVLLSGGQVAYRGEVGEVIKRYMAASNALATLSLQNRSDRKGSGVMEFRTVTLRDGNGRVVRSFASGSTANIELGIGRRAPGSLRSVRVDIGIDNDVGQRILLLSTTLGGSDFGDLGPDVDRISVTIPRLPLAVGLYGFTLHATVNGEVADWVRSAGSFAVDGGDFYGSGQVPPGGQGFMLVDHQFSAHEEALTAKAPLCDTP